MKRSAIVRKTPMKRGTSTLARSAFKKSTPKKRAGHDKAKRDACRDQPCYLVLPLTCRGAVDYDTVVPAHSNESTHGKGMGLKADDEYTVPACIRCHAELDQGKKFTKEEKQAFWRAAFARWQPVRDALSAAIPADAKTAASTGVQSLGSRLINQ